MNQKISIIVPIYNSSKTLRRTIDSILNQSYTNLEILLINDGSTDDSLDICNEYAKKDERIIVISQTNKGVGEARNKGLDFASGEFISFVDSDDTMDNNFFKELMATQLETKADIVESGAKVVLDKDNNIYPYEKPTKLNLFDNHDYMKNYLNFSLNVSVWGKIYKKSLIGNLRFPKFNINEDFVFLWEIVKKTCCFCENLNTNYHYYLDKPESLSKAPFRKENMTMIEHIEDVVRDVNKIYPDLNPEALNHYNACLLHNLVLYYNYLKSQTVKDLYLEDRDKMISEAKKIEKITSYLLLHEAQYNIQNLISDVLSLSNEKRKK